MFERHIIQIKIAFISKHTESTKNSKSNLTSSVTHDGHVCFQSTMDR